MPSSKILLVDDDRNILTAVGMTLEAEGFEVEAENNGSDGYLSALNERHELIVLDIKMPGMDGMDIIQRLRAQNIHTPIICLTSKDDEIDEVLALRAGANDYVRKPFSQRLLVERIRSTLRAHAAFTSSSKISSQSTKVQDGTIPSQLGGTDRSVLVSKILHDLSGKLALITTNLELWEEKILTSDQLASLTHTTVHQIFIMLEELRYYVQNKPIRKTSFAIHDAMNLASSIFKNSVDEQLKFSVSDSTPEKTIATTSKEFLVSLLVGLLDNSYQHAFRKSDENVRSIELSSALNESTSCVRFQIKDNGQGVPAEVLQKIFKEPVRSKRGHGTNLYLSRKIAIDLGWDLSLVSSSPEKGTIFELAISVNRG